MSFSELELPSNRKFGLFFVTVALAVSGYLYLSGSLGLAIGSLAIATAFLLVSLLKPHWLMPLNILWLRFGFLIGMVVHPIVLGLIFFALITPMAFLMRLFGRDELRLRLDWKPSH